MLLFTFLVVNNQVRNNAKSSIYKNFRRTETAFEEFKARRLETIASEIYSVTSRNPRFFSILAESAHQTGDRGGDLGFDTAPSKGGGRHPQGQSNLPDLHRLLLSLLPDTVLYRRTDIFIVVNLGGTVLFNKAKRDEFGNDLSLNPVVAAALSGQQVPFLYATPRSFFGAGIHYAEPLADRIEQIIVMPVEHRHHILGAVIVGDAAEPFISDV
ncbi:MAG: hypothetical protein HYU64_05225, partial [Armatimonadetes bacterium]|nr:hypothetical protein [Armatimonadota bacterium]